MESKNLLIIILIIVVGVGGFFAGIKYQQSKQPSRIDFQGIREMRRSGLPTNWRREGLKALRGEIIAKDENSITIKLLDGSSKIILVSKKTIINKATEGSINDLKTGKQIMVFGQENSDKTISADTIQLDFGFIRNNQRN